ncbi:hypothetical protein BJ508DRAFT_323927 [Ascobolus immersus RN42]|uniref:Uncharacterized protein n=1 Tax=Ascobolus immersus RN42 TaxID=1160509 RepID=A0A3N4IEP9_ASCIM|nr:hypothetical protein BJ508DRAFT_323927 [Ascobolus immersus RN42]
MLPLFTLLATFLHLRAVLAIPLPDLTPLLKEPTLPIPIPIAIAPEPASDPSNNHSPLVIACIVVTLVATISLVSISLWYVRKLVTTGKQTFLKAEKPPVDEEVFLNGAFDAEEDELRLEGKRHAEPGDRNDGFVTVQTHHRSYWPPQTT